MHLKGGEYMENNSSEKFLKSLGKRVKDRRIAMGMSQEDLARKCDYAARSSINRLEQGLLDIPHSKIIAVANALGVSPFWVMGWEDGCGKVFKVVEDDFPLSGFEKTIITAYRNADEYTQGLVVRSLNLDEEYESFKKESSGNNLA